jgi:DNA-binding transcriptional regulator LsrR (DeoR family)
MSDRAFLGKLAWLYYIDGLTQKEIGLRVGLSRLKVVRLLQRARAEGVVQIQIAPELRLNTELARGLEERFDLQEAIVTEPDEEGETIGRAGARFLERMLKDNLTLGIGMGRTIASLLPHISTQKLDNVVIRTLAGVYEEPSRETNAYNISWRLADLFNAVVEPLHSPLIVANGATRSALLEDRVVRTVLESLEACDLALIGLGALDEGSPLTRLGYCTPEQLTNLKAKGAVGEILGRFYDLEGQTIPTEFDERMIGITLDGLCRIPTVVALAYGEGKVRPTLGALRTGCIDVLITDRWTAEAILVTESIHNEPKREKTVSNNSSTSSPKNQTLKGVDPDEARKI